MDKQFKYLMYSGVKFAKKTQKNSSKKIIERKQCVQPV